MRAGAAGGGGWGEAASRSELVAVFAVRFSHCGP